MMPRALITGITGQDGSHLAELLLGKGYQVHGMVRNVDPERCHRLRGIRDRVELHPGDLLDQAVLLRVLEQIQPDEIYNLAAWSFVGSSWQHPVATTESTATAVVRLLEAIREVCPQARFYQASSSEMFGRVTESPQNETTPFHPRSPYGVAKVFGHLMTVNFRENQDMFACSGILYNHEGPRRGLEFVTRKISRGAASIKLGLTQELRLGDLSARRDWGFAGDYVQAMWLMLQQETPDDYVIGTGETHTVEEFVCTAFEHVGLDWHKHVVIDPAFCRPGDVDLLVADPSKARRQLGWKAEVGFEQLVQLMVDHDLAELTL